MRQLNQVNRRITVSPSQPLGCQYMTDQINLIESLALQLGHHDCI